MAATPARFIKRDTFPAQPISDEQFAAARIEGRWTPLTITAAEWAVHKLMDAAAELDAIKVEIRDYVSEVRAWSEDKLRTGRAAELTRDIEFFEGALRNYARGIRDASVGADGEPTIKTIKLPSATLETVKAKDRKPKFAVEDAPRLVEWARSGAPHALVEAVDLKKLNLVVVTNEDGDVVMTEGGELVPGVSFTWDDEPREPAVHIRLKAIGRGDD